MSWWERLYPELFDRSCDEEGGRHLTVDLNVTMRRERKNVWERLYPELFDDDYKDEDEDEDCPDPSTIS